MSKWYTTGFNEGLAGSYDPPMQPGHKAHSAYLEGYADGQRQAELDAELDTPFHVVGIDGSDGSATLLNEFTNSGEARAFMQRYVSRENAGGWDQVLVLDTRSECAETLWRWDRDTPN